MTEYKKIIYIDTDTMALKVGRYLPRLSGMNLMVVSALSEYRSSGS